MHRKDQHRCVVSSVRVAPRTADTHGHGDMPHTGDRHRCSMCKWLTPFQRQGRSSKGARARPQSASASQATGAALPSERTHHKRSNRVVAVNCHARAIPFTPNGSNNTKHPTSNAQRAHNRFCNLDSQEPHLNTQRKPIPVKSLRLANQRLAAPNRGTSAPHAQ